MENYKLVMPEHLNHYGFLFGGYMLKWVDEIAWIAASLDYPGFLFVTIAMDEVEFRKSVRQGTILKFTTKLIRKGKTSVNYQVDVERACGVESSSPDNEPESIFSTVVTMVRVNEQGEKTPIEEGD